MAARAVARAKAEVRIRATGTPMEAAARASSVVARRARPQAPPSSRCTRPSASAATASATMWNQVWARPPSGNHDGPAGIGIRGGPRSPPVNGRNSRTRLGSTTATQNVITARYWPRIRSAGNPTATPATAPTRAAMATPIRGSIPYRPAMPTA